MDEASIQSQILLQVARGPVRLFRNNVGTGWTGRLEWLPGRRDVIVRGARPLHAGLMKGSGDLLGWRTITITPDMVGQRVAVFASLEVKGPRGRTSPEQDAWAAAVQQAGGLGGTARSVADAQGVLRLG